MYVSREFGAAGRLACAFEEWLFMPGHTRARRTGRSQWNIARPDPQALLRLEREGGFSPLLARALASRGLISLPDARLFLDARLADHLGDPFSMKDMEPAAERVAEAVRRGEPLAIFGDYDVDGITATVLLIRLFRWLKLEPAYYIPHRIDEGYGMSCDAVGQLAAKGVTLLITVDNGISSCEEIEFARSLGLDCVVTDHHQPGAELPRACAVVDPSRADCAYGFCHLSGVGVAFKLAHAVLRRLAVEERAAKEFLKSLLDIVALGTVADIVPLVGENRALVRAGLARLDRTDNPGLAALLALANRNGQPLQAESITYFLAPRLNAAGRTEHASLAVELLTTNERRRAAELARQLDELNTRRRVVEQGIFEEALRLVAEQCRMETDPVYIVVGQRWHLGVVGIVASKLSDRFHRPVIILSETDGLVRGSARSIAGLDIHTVLGRCADILTTFGGHREAAGLTLPADRLPALRERLNAAADELFQDEDACDELPVDGVCRPDDLSVDAVDDLLGLEPCGYGNPKAVFALLAADVTREPRLVGHNHLKLSVAAGASDFDVIGFGMGAALPELRAIQGPIDLAFQPVLSQWSGSMQVELQLQDFRPAQP